MNTVTEKQRSPQILKDQRVLRLWLAQSVSSLGDFIALFAIFAVVTFKLHGKPTQIAEVVVAFMIPMAIVSPLAGVLVDRSNVKRAMIASDIIRLFLAFALAFTSDLQSICILLASLSTVSSFLARRNPSYLSLSFLRRICWRGTRSSRSQHRLFRSLVLRSLASWSSGAERILVSISMLSRLGSQRRLSALSERT